MSPRHVPKATFAAAALRGGAAFVVGVWVPLLAAVAGCEGAAPLTTAFQVRDSAGVAIVWNGGIGVWGPEPVDSLVEELRIGVDTGDERYVLAAPEKVVEGADGSLYVADGVSRRIRRYDRDGRHLRDYGRSGEGPGEFPRALDDIWLSGSTVVGVDWQQWGRVNAWEATGELAETVDKYMRGIPNAFPFGGGPGAWLLAVMDFSEHALAADRGDTVASLPVVRASALQDTVSMTYLADLPWGPWIPMEAEEGRPTVPLFSRTGSTNVPRDFFIIQPDRLLVHAGTPYEVRELDSQGQLRRIVRSDFQPSPLGQRAARRYVRAFAAHLDSFPPDAFDTPPQRQLQDVERRAALVTTDTVPPLARLVAGLDGSLWLRRGDLDGDPVALAIEDRFDLFVARPSFWDVFDAEGRLQGQVRLAENFTPWVVSATTVTGILRDGMGVEYVVRYRVIPPA